MKILIVSNGIIGKGGWYTYTKSLIDELEADGNEVYNANDLGVPLSFFANPLLAILRMRRLRKSIKEAQPDIIHITVEPYSAILPMLGKAIAAKTVLTIHGSYGVRMWEGMINRMRSKWVLQNIGRYICVSTYTQVRIADEIQSIFGERAKRNFQEKAHVIPNGTYINHDIAFPSNTTKQVLCVGAVKPRKGMLESLKALAEYVKNKDRNIHMTIVGSYNPEDPYMQRLQNFIVDRNLSDYVTFTGIISDNDLRRLYEQADLYLMPAKTTHDAFEGFGLVYIEAASYGIPCIGTNDSGAAEAIKQEVSGYKCDPHDTEGIANSMEEILINHTIDRKKCREWAEQHSVKNMTNLTLSVYEMLQ